MEQWWTAFKKSSVPIPPYNDYAMLGLFDSDALMPFLSRLWRHPSTPLPEKVYFVDIGANVGLTSQSMLTYFSGWMCLKSKHAHAACDTNPSGGIHAFDASPATFSLLQARAKEEDWKLGGWEGHLFAVSDKTGPVTFYSGEGGSEQSSLDEIAAGKDTKAVTVNGTSLDDWMKNQPSWEKSLIWLLKIDTEGYDMTTLLGASNLLQKQLVKFLVFEYNFKWFTNNRTHTLKQTVASLEPQMHCFFITRENLVPITGEWWHDGFEIKKWSNVFCASKSDVDLPRVLMGYNWDSTLTLAWLQHVDIL